MQFILENNLVKLIDYRRYEKLGNDLLVANAARVSMNKESTKFTKIGETKRSDEALLKYMADPNKDGKFERIHFTPFCHPQYLFLITMPTDKLVERCFNTSLNQTSRVVVEHDSFRVGGRSKKYTTFLERGSLYHYIQMKEIHPDILTTAFHSIKAFTPPTINSEISDNKKSGSRLREYYFDQFLDYCNKNDMEMTGMNKYITNPEAFQSDFELTKEQYLDLMPATFHITIPIVDANQYKRHAGNSQINEVSRRYVDDEPIFHSITDWRMRAKNIKQGSSEQTITNDLLASEITEMYCVQGKHVYEKLLEMGVAPELARRHLPLSIYTTFYQTGPLSLFERICYLRDDPHAQKEIRHYAQAIKHTLKNTVHNRVLEY